MPEENPEIIDKIDLLKKQADKAIKGGALETAAGLMLEAVELADLPEAPASINIVPLMLKYRDLLLKTGEIDAAAGVSEGLSVVMSPEEVAIYRSTNPDDPTPIPPPPEFLRDEDHSRRPAEDISDPPTPAEESDPPATAPSGTTTTPLPDPTPEGNKQPETERPRPRPPTTPPTETPPVTSVPDLKDRPLFFVPGILGSQLAKRVFRNGRKITVKPFWPPDIPLMQDRSAILSEMVSGLTTSAEVEAIGLFPGAYTPLIEGIKAMGYKLNHDFFIFPYDWRRSNRVSGAALSKAIKAVVDGNPKWDKADVVCHSMGGFVTRMAHKLGAPIDRTIYIASPHYGAAKAHFVLHPGVQLTSFFESLIFETAWQRVFRRKGDSPDIERRLKEAARGFPSVWELMPDTYGIDTLKLEFIWYEGRSGRHNRWIGTAQDTYFGRRYGFDQTRHNDVQNALDFKDKTIGPAMPGPPAKSLVIWSDSEDPTYDSITYKRVGSRGDSTPDYWYNKRDYGFHGDGTVPTISARDFKGAVNKIRIPGEHSRVANEPQTIIEIGKFLA